MQKECENHPLLLDNRTQQEKDQGVPLVKTAVTHLNDFSVTMRAWARNYSDVFQLRWDVYESVKNVLTEKGLRYHFLIVR